MGRIHDLLMSCDSYYQMFLHTRNEKKKIHDSRRQKLLAQYPLTEEQRRQIDDLFLTNYGKKIPYDWHRLYASYTGKFDPAYMPELLFIPQIQAKLVKPEYFCLADKNMLPALVSSENGVRTAKVLGSCVHGHYRDENQHLVTKEDFCKMLENLGKVFLKQTVDTNSGKGCMVADFRNAVDQISGQTAEQILKLMGKNFNIQELLVNSESLRTLYPNSINTIRITTYIWKDKIFHFPVLLRIGRGGGYLDNAHQGGMFVGVEDDGRLLTCAYTEFQERFTEHPDTHVKFDGYVLPEIPKVLKDIYHAHERIPYVGMISWDVTVDENGSTVIIEANLEGQTIWMTQMAHGKAAFGENTAEILRSIRKH